MAVSIANIPKNTNVYRFITDGKPGGCFLCGKWFDKIEAHHVSYYPEIKAGLCHLCHHTVHFWPNRLSDELKLKLLFLKFPHRQAWIKLGQTENNPKELAKLIAPSRNEFVRSKQALEIKRIKKP